MISRSGVFYLPNVWHSDRYSGGFLFRMFCRSSSAGTTLNHYAILSHLKYPVSNRLISRNDTREIIWFRIRKVNMYIR